MYCSVEIITEFSPCVCASVCVCECVCVCAHGGSHVYTMTVKAKDHHRVITVEPSTLFYEIASLTWA